MDRLRFVLHIFESVYFFSAAANFQTMAASFFFSSLSSCVVCPTRLWM